MGILIVIGVLNEDALVLLNHDWSSSISNNTFYMILRTTLAAVLDYSLVEL